MIVLRGGYKTEDRRLDRIPQFDERSRDYPIRKLIGDKKPRSYTWRCSSWLDQGSEGACVGFSFAHELAGKPKPMPFITEQTAKIIYREAQKIDEWHGEAYEGTSVLAGAKVVVKKGGMKEYRWAFGIEDLKLAVGYAGPAVIGVDWYTGMFDTDATGFISATGTVAGGHAILCHGISIKKKAFKLHNSWGRDWGMDGECWISFDDMDKLLRQQGEACIVLGRKSKLLD